MVYFLNQDILPVRFYNMVPQTAKTDWKVKGKKQEARDKKSLKQFHSQKLHVSTCPVVQAFLCLTLEFWAPSLIKEYSRCWWAEVLLILVENQTNKKSEVYIVSSLSGSQPSSCDCHCCNGQWIKQLFPHNRRKPCDSVPGMEGLTGITVQGKWTMVECRQSPRHVAEKGEGQSDEQSSSHQPRKGLGHTSVPARGRVGFRNAGNRRG